MRVQVPPSALARWKAGILFLAWVFMRARFIQILRISLFIVLTVSFLVFIPIQKIMNTVGEANPWYFWMSYLLGFPASYLAAVRLWILTRKQEIQVSPLKLMEINFVIRFYSFFSPASAVGSIMRWYKLSDNGKSAEALTAVAMNRLFDVFISITFGLFWVFGMRNASMIIQPLWIILFLVATLFVWLFVTRYSHPILFWMHRMTQNNQRNLVRKIGYYIERLSASLLVYSKLKAHILLLMIMIAFLSEFVGVLGFYYLALAIDLQVQFTNLGWMRSVFFLTSLAPFTLVGGGGLREVSIVWILTTIGFHTDLAVAFSFLVYARSVITSLTGGLMELFSLHR